MVNPTASWFLLLGSVPQCSRAGARALVHGAFAAPTCPCLTQVSCPYSVGGSRHAEAFDQGISLGVEERQLVGSDVVGTSVGGDASRGCGLLVANISNQLSEAVVDRVTLTFSYFGHRFDALQVAMSEVSKSVVFKNSSAARSRTPRTPLPYA